MRNVLCGGLLMNTKTGAHRQHKILASWLVGLPVELGQAGGKKAGESLEKEGKKHGWNSQSSAGVGLEGSRKVSEGQGEKVSWLGNWGRWGWHLEVHSEHLAPATHPSLQRSIDATDDADVRLQESSYNTWNTQVLLKT